MRKLCLISFIFLNTLTTSLRKSFIIIFPFGEFFTQALADGFSHESEWQQVSSSLQNSSQYSSQSQQCYSLDGLHSSFSTSTNPFVTVPSAPIIIGITVTLPFTKDILGRTWTQQFKASLFLCSLSLSLSLSVGLSSFDHKYLSLYLFNLILSLSLSLSHTHTHTHTHS